MIRPRILIAKIHLILSVLFLLQFFLLTLVGNNEFYNIETKISMLKLDFMFKSFGDEIKRETYSDFVVNNNEFIILPVVKMNS